MIASMNTPLTDAAYAAEFERIVARVRALRQTPNFAGVLDDIADEEARLETLRERDELRESGWGRDGNDMAR